ncbi:hypothetical protein BKA56DRAFT_621045 [Ilyonectria sp. MPI-CAGE-AT-0026]|nr:hypothetical protein BKA56DRAFT_621045 [Ilyonectria sp. MPI-CAGE-AT-0026]
MPCLKTNLDSGVTHVTLQLPVWPTQSPALLTGTVSSAITVSGGADWTVVKNNLVLSFGIDYSRTWTTQTINVKGTVANGWSGVMITKPIKTRKYGRQMKGCIGSRTETGTWMPDFYEEGSYGGVQWVSGAISTFNSADHCSIANST